jgi:tRNA threonylcarbamoyl adenosine modification protein (Sua5/YciO/YrdC/YwlC family)
LTEFFEIDRDHPRPDWIHRVARALRDGKLVGCPTDTTYGVLASIDQREAITRLTRLRIEMGDDPEVPEAEREKTLSMIFADLDMLSGYVVLTGLAFQLVKRLLPGPYTLILPASRTVPKALLSRRREIGARIPDDNLVRALVRALGAPVLTTTAKGRDGELVGDAGTLAEDWPWGVDLVIDAGPIVPEPSTVLSIEDDQVVVVREGKGPVEGV